MDIFAHSIFKSRISSSFNCQLISELLSFCDNENNVNATDTDILKLSVNPYMGILTNLSACLRAISDKPSFSVPNSIADF